MVKNKGFLPATPSEIPIQRKEIKEIIFSLLPACKDPDTDTGAPFNVNAIIANPAAYGNSYFYNVVCQLFTFVEFVLILCL
jgi:sterol 3beta-glucosyltransferase